MGWVNLGGQFLSGIIAVDNLDAGIEIGDIAEGQIPT